MVGAKKHILIPKHAKLSEKEKTAILDKYKISVAELPSIKLSDPAIKDTDVKEGDVIKIERDSPTSGKTVFYRGVLNG